jgi:hypothetical protein
MLTHPPPGPVPARFPPPIPLQFPTLSSALTASVVEGDSGNASFTILLTLTNPAVRRLPKDRIG